MKNYYNEEFKKFLQKIENEGGAITNFAEQDKEGNFINYQYATIEYGFCFWYIQVEYFGGVSCTQYIKKSYDRKIQAGYPTTYNNFTEVYKHIINAPYIAMPLSGVHEQPINWINKNKIFSISGSREKEVLKHINYIKMIQHDKDYKVLRFCDMIGNYFDYEVNKNIITG